MFEQYRGKRVFVSGHTGFKGSWLSEWLLGLGAEVAGYSIDLPSDPCHFSLLYLNDRMQHIIGDVRDLEHLRSVIQAFQPDILFHLAAQPIVSIALADPVDTFSTNIMGTANILEAVRSTPSIQAALMVTSDKCYENVEWEYGYRESDPLGGKDPYSASKAGAEIVFHSYFRSYFQDKSDSVRLATARAGNVIGGGDWAQDRLIPDCIKAWGRSERPFIRNPLATRPWQHVLEPLRAYLQLAVELFQNAPAINGESFNFGPAAGQNYSVGDVLEEIKRTWPSIGWECKVDPLVQKECSLLKLNCDKSLARLGWLPGLDFQETIQLTTEWYRSYYARKEMQSITQGQIDWYVKKLSQKVPLDLTVSSLQSAP